MFTDEIFIGGKSFKPLGKTLLYIADVDFQDLKKVYWGRFLETLDGINIKNCKFQSLDGIEVLPKLYQVWIEAIDPFDFSALGKCENLAYLKFVHVNLEDLSVFTNLTKLIELNISYSQIKRIEGLEKLQDLERLTISNSNLSGIAGLNSLQKLKNIDFSFNQITEIKALENLPKLERIILKNNLIEDMSGLDPLNNLRYLDLTANKITELKGLHRKYDLKELRLANNLITEIRNLDDLFSLAELDLENNQISELKGLKFQCRANIFNLKGNPLPKDILSLHSADLVRKCGGVHYARTPIIGAKPSGINVIPFEHAIIFNNSNAQCLYCGRPISPGENQRERIERDLIKLVTETNAKIPDTYKTTESALKRKLVH